MAASQRFRSAFNGFNREDVVHYIEYLNNQHASQVEQLNNQHTSQIEQLNAQLQAALDKVPDSPAPDLQQQLDAALARCQELEAQLTEKNTVSDTAADELEAYRRAERAERLAQERAQQIYAQANAVLADAALKAESAAAHIGTVADQAAAQLKDCQDTVAAAKASFQEAVTALYAIRPEEP